MIFLYGYDEDESGPIHPYESVAYQRMKTAADTPAAEAAALKNKEESEDETSDEETSEYDNEKSNEETTNNIKAALKESEVTAVANSKDAKANAAKDTSLVVTPKVATKTKP
jgi:hypothetical protein